MAADLHSHACKEQLGRFFMMEAASADAKQSMFPSPQMPTCVGVHTDAHLYPHSQTNKESQQWKCRRTSNCSTV